MLIICLGGLGYYRERCLWHQIVLLEKSLSEKEQNLAENLQILHAELDKDRIVNVHSPIPLVEPFNESINSSMHEELERLNSTLEAQKERLTRSTDTLQ